MAADLHCSCFGVHSLLCLHAGSIKQVSAYQVKLVGDLLQEDDTADVSVAVWDVLHEAINPQSELPPPTQVCMQIAKDPE